MTNEFEVDFKAKGSLPKKPKFPMLGHNLLILLLVFLVGILVGSSHFQVGLNILLSFFQRQDTKPDLKQPETDVASTSPSDEVTGKEEESLTDDINDGVYPDPLAALPPGQCLRLASSDITSSIWQELPSVAQVVRDAEKREQVMDYANAAFFFNEANALIKDAGDNTDNQHKISDYEIIDIYTELRIYENFSEILDISNPVKCDPDQEKYVMTPEMVEAVEDFQKQAGIPITGDLDFSTMQKLVTALPHPSSSDNWPGSSSS